MKKRLLAMLLVLIMVVSLLPVGALADDGYYSNEFVTFEYDGAQGAITETKQYTVNLIKPDGSLLNSFTVPDYNRSDSHDNKLTLSGSISGEYEIDSISQDPGIISSSSINKSEVTYHSTFTGDSATLTVQLAEVFDESNVEINGGEVGHAGVVYFDVINYEILKMLYIAGENVSADTSIDSVTLRYVEDNLSLKTESFDILAGYNATEYVDYWQADASNAAYLATPYNVRQLEIEHDGVTTVIPYTELKFTRDGDHYWIEARDDSPYIVAFYNENGADSGNDYTLYAIRFVENSGETVSENGGMPSDPTYPATTYEFVGWTYGYDGGSPFLGTTPVNEDTVVYAQKTLSSNASEIHVMNNDDLLKERIQELYGEDDIDWDSIKISVYAGTEHTNPDYNLSPNSNGWRDEDSYYFVYNYLTGAGQQENDSIYINDITHIAVTAKDTDGKDLGEVIINKGVYDGDFAVSTGSQGSSYIIELYIIDNGIQPPEPEPEEYTLTTSADENSTIDVGKTYEYSENGTIEVKFTANSGYAIDTVTVDNRKLDGDELAAAIENGCVVVDMKGDHSVAVTSSAKTYRLSYKWDSDFYDEAELPPAEEHQYGETFSLSDMYEVGNTITTEKYVYEFQGWKYGGKLVTEITMPASDISVEGKWINKGEAPKYNVTYEFEGDEPESFTPNIDEYDIFKNEQAPGSIQNVPTGLKAESEDGTWTFNGWTSEDVVISDDNKFTMPAKDVHLVGTWTFTPNEPEQPTVYEIYVTVHNGTATFCGSEVTRYILAVEGEDITITFTPDEGYTLDYATIDGNTLQIPDDGVYTLKLVDSDHTIEVFYESDKIGTEDPNEGDGVPDKYQATVNFVAGENGKVTGDVTKVYTIVGEDGKYAEEGVITPSLEGVTVTPDEGYKVDGWTNAADERVNPESEITVEGGDVVVFTVNFQSDPSLKEITSFEKKLVTDRKTYRSFGLRVPTFIRNGSTVVVDEGKGVTLLYAISLTGTPGAEYAITDTGADVADGYALTGVIPEAGVVTVYVTKDFTWREAAAAAYKDDALVNTAAVELTDNPNEPGQESTEEVDVVIDWDDPNVPVVPSDPDDDEDEDDEVFVPNWLNTEDHYSYIVGYEDGTIKPNNNITRAEVATIFFRLLTDNARERYWSTTNDFSDVAAESWYNNAISTLSNMGIINGYEDGTFKPNAPITRAEFTAIATRFFDYEAEYDGAFNDVSARAWYADYVQAAVDMGLVDGYPDGGFHPDAYITRAEACTIVNRVLHRVPHEDHLLAESVMNTWPDNPKSAWYYEDMQEATNSHDYDWIRVDGETVEDWTKKLPERDWSALETEWATAYSR